MSAIEPPDRRLEAARQALRGRGYLAEGVPRAPWSWRAVAVRLALFAAALAVTLAVAEVGFAGQPLGLVAPVAAGYLPAALLATLLGYCLCRMLAAAALALGGEPEAIGSAVAALAGVAILSSLAAMGRPTTPGLATVPGIALGVLAALLAMAWMRHHLADLLAPPGTAPSRGGTPVVPLLVIVVGGVLAVLVVAQRRGEPATVGAPTFPQARGRVAVLAVDGLAREDLEAGAALVGGRGLRDATLWGWAPMEPPDSPLPVVFWTTVACGVPPGVHGIAVLEEVRLFGLADGLPLSRLGRFAVALPLQAVGLARVVARPATVRHRATFWEMASRAGVGVTVGGWWGSWPVRRLLGEVASERAWLGGDHGPDAVTPGLAAVVAAVAGNGTVHPASRSDRLALALSEAIAATSAPHLAAIAMPALDIERRTTPDATPLALADRLLPHLEALDAVIDRLLQADYQVFLIGVPWQGGTAFVASSAAVAGRHEALPAVALAPSVLDALGLPPASGLLAPRRDLSAAEGPLAAPVAYGPPPPPVAAPSPRGQEVQRELLRNLGYLQ